MTFHQKLETILQMSRPDEKVAAFHSFYADYRDGKVAFETEFAAKTFDAPSYAKQCRIVPPQDVPHRKNPATKEGKVLLLHAIAHIEYSAIDLALDHAYRFVGLPRAYYDDWLKVADDEIRHFEMIESLLHELNSFYGAIAVHNGLFDAGRKTETFLERMAIIPRFFEANGLDATPQILKRLKPIRGDAMIERIVEALHVIMHEEIDHVLKGDRWFAYACEMEGVDPSIYFDIVDRLYPNSFPRQKYLNVEARKEAGFSCQELEKMSGTKICDEKEQ